MERVIWRLSRVLLVSSFVLTCFALGGCQVQANTAGEKALRAVESKYGEDFEISSVGGAFGTSDNNTWKVILRPASDSSLEFVATVDKQSSEVVDYYLSALMARRLQTQLQGEIGGLYTERVLVVAHPVLENKTDSEVGDKDMSASAFFQANEDERVAVALLLDADEPPRSFEDMVTEVGTTVGQLVPRALVYVALAENGTFDEITSSPDDSELQDIAGYSVNGRGAGAEVNDQVVRILYVN